MRVEIKPSSAYHMINHGPCNLVSTGDETRKNIAPINWTMPLNNDPALVLTVLEEGIYTEKLLLETKEFVINVVGESLADATLGCGKFHGDKINKFEKFNLTPATSKTVKAPYLKESLGHLECKMIGKHPYDGVVIYTGQVLHAEMEEEYWDGKSIIIEKVKSIHHLSGGSFAVADRLITVKK